MKRGERYIEKDERILSLFEEFMNIPRITSIEDFDNYVHAFLKRRTDKALGLKELDNIIAVLQNYILLLSLHYKQNYILHKQEPIEPNKEVYYTKKEVAKIYRVSERTITNWIYAGLETVVIGGVVRVSKMSIERFVFKK